MAEPAATPRPPTPLGFDASRAADRAADPAGWRFPDEDRRALRDIVAARRDIRRFRPDPVPDDVLERVLEAAHRGPSVGLSQPWRFLLVRERATRAAMRSLAQRERLLQADRFSDRARHFMDQKIEGVVDAPLGIVVCCDPGEPGVEVLGRGTIPETAEHSTACAIQNLWLAARAEGLGVGWVSFYRREDLRALLGIPDRVDPMAWLCVGWPDERPVRPGLESAGWSERAPLSSVVLEERWPAGDVAQVGGAVPTVGGEDGPRADPGPGGDAETGARGGMGPEAVPSAGAAPVRPAASDPAAGLPAALRRLVAPDEDPRAAARDERNATAVRDRSDRLVKPLGSLGVLEALTERWAAWTGDAPPSPLRPGIVVLCGDHGHVARGTSLYDATVSAQVAATAARGGSAIGVLAAHHAGLLRVVDVGLAGPTPPGVAPAKVAPGTADLATAPAMTEEEAVAAVLAGAEAADAVLDRGARCLLPGEIGIGNTTAAAALACALCGLDPEHAVGRGAGADAASLERKRATVGAALERLRGAGAGPGSTIAAADPPGALRVLAELGGLELAGVVGAILAAARRRVPVLLDGFAVGTAAIVAVRLRPAVRDGLFAGHRSAEAAHGTVLSTLGLEPLLDLRLRLGEASGAALALPLVEAAGRLHRDVETFAEAGIDPPRGAGAPT